jgi:N-acetylmuramoyl-L-alanine amidase
LHLTAELTTSMMRCMKPASCGAQLSRTIHKLIFFTVSAVISIQSVQAERWDAQGALKAFQEAKQKRNDLGQAIQPSSAQYLECARSFRNIYVKNPHFGHAGEAIFEEAAVFQEMGDKFGELDYYRTAIKRFLLLVKEYEGNQKCPDALERLGEIYSKRLMDEVSAQDVYKTLKSEYPNSGAALRLKHPVAASKSVTPQKPEEPLKQAETPHRDISTLQSVRFWTANDYTRVSIDMDLETTFEKYRISDPERVYIDIPNAQISKELQERTFTVGDSILKQIRIAQNRANLIRVVLDCADTFDFSMSELRNPYRIVIDLHPRLQSERSSKKPELKASPPPADKKSESTPIDTVSASSAKPASDKPSTSVESIPSPGSAKESRPSDAHPSKFEPAIKPEKAKTTEKAKKPPLAITAEKELSPKPAMPTSQGDRTFTRMLGLKVGRIVIDPGHGGHDQGTIGPSGLLEKDLVLSLAIGLEKMLREKLGAEVFLTRRDDTFIPLEERTAIANQHRADLFISIHANSSKIKSISGIETYYLSFAKTSSEREIAARENATTVNNVADLEDLIKKIAQADKSAESKELASIIQKKLFSGAKQLFPGTQNRGVRSAPFIVLIGANMPSVLVEVAFISNPKDEKFLKIEANHDFFEKALYSGVESYIKTLGSDANLNQQVQKQ